MSRVNSWAPLVAHACILTALAVPGLSPARSPLPETMHAAAIDAAGGPQMLTLHTVPVPKVDADEVLIALHAAGVGPWDADIRKKPTYIQHSAFPLILGVDGAGTVAALGSAVHDFKVGDKVWAYSWDNPKGGFYAEYVAVPQKTVGHMPRGMTFEDAGVGAVSALTAIQGIDDALHVKRGETLIIHGAAGGVGTLALQFAKLRGARVLATASGEDGAKFVRDLGADAVVDGRQGDIVAAAHALAPGGVDAVLALAGGDSLERCMDALKPGGELAFPSGVRPEPARSGVHVIRYDAVPGPAEYARLDQAVIAARLRVPIAAAFPLADAARAHERLDAGHVLGKIVLTIP